MVKEKVCTYLADQPMGTEKDGLVGDPGNVFVLSTGRSGTTTFIRACDHISNYSAGHETRVNQLGEERLAYPERHIEADNRLTWFLGRLEEKYGDKACYVHLIRDRQAVAKSLTKRYWNGIMRPYHNNGILMNLPKDVDPYEICLDYYDTVNANIRAFLRGKPMVQEIHLETIEEGFTEFWKAIGAEGNLDVALGEFKVRHNRTGKDRPSILVRARHKIKRALWAYLASHTG